MRDALQLDGSTELNSATFESQSLVTQIASSTCGRQRTAHAFNTEW